MTRTPNHGYNVPKEGTQDWHEPLNENFEAYDTDIELRDESANLSSYEPIDGAKFLATDTGVVYLGDGNAWVETVTTGRYEAPADGDAGGIAFGDPANEAVSSGGTVGGGRGNEASRAYATVAGGDGNSAADVGATVGGGVDNRASGESSTVAGGEGNVASGDYSFAAGRNAEAQRTGSFVWNNTDSRFVTSAEGQFLVNARGGVGIGTNTPGENQFVVDVDGGVGIGTDSPNAPLHVWGTDDPALDGDLVVGSSDEQLSVRVQTSGDDAGTVRLRARGADDEDNHNLLLGGGSNDVLRIRAGPEGVRSVVPVENESVILGWVEQRWSSIDVETVYTDTVSETSDARLKTNVSRLRDGLETVGALRPVTYEWRDESREDGTQLGLIAQEVREVLPEVVDTERDDEDGNGHLSVNYTKLVPVLVDALQRQQAGIEEREERVDRLERESEQKDERIETLEARNDDLEARLSALEARVGRAEPGMAGD